MIQCVGIESATMRCVVWFSTALLFCLYGQSTGDPMIYDPAIVQQCKMNTSAPEDEVKGILAESLDDVSDAAKEFVKCYAVISGLIDLEGKFIPDRLDASGRPPQAGIDKCAGQFPIVNNADEMFQLRNCLINEKA